MQSSGTVPHSGEARQEPEAAGHVAATVRKYREMNARAPPTFSFYSIQDTTLCMVQPTIMVGLPTSISLVKIVSHRHGQRLVF